MTCKDCEKIQKEMDALRKERKEIIDLVKDKYCDVSDIDDVESCHEMNCDNRGIFDLGTAFEEREWQGCVCLYHAIEQQLMAEQQDVEIIKQETEEKDKRIIELEKEMDALRKEAKDALRNSTIDMAKIVGEKDKRIHELEQEIKDIGCSVWCVNCGSIQHFHNARQEWKEGLRGVCPLCKEDMVCLEGTSWSHEEVGQDAICENRLPCNTFMTEDGKRIKELERERDELKKKVKKDG